ncbi:EF-hand domain-containing protein [Silicimonas sp. MF1-12-2]|uniref:EF-hand domain-containing protein n=1 Tax=Silicimonas sp. MF1-12-2 TaxID=3384793 RepID=UPI0039B4D515
MKREALALVVTVLATQAASAGENFNASPSGASGSLLVANPGNAAVAMSVFRNDAGKDGQGPGMLHLRKLGFSEIDTDGDGRISFEELYRADGPSLTLLRGN